MTLIAHIGHQVSDHRFRVTIRFRKRVLAAYVIERRSLYPVVVARHVRPAYPTPVALFVRVHPGWVRYGALIGGWTASTVALGWAKRPIGEGPARQRVRI